MTMWFNGALPIVTISRVNSCVTRSASSRFTTKRAMLLSYEFTPGAPVVGPFVLPDARPSSKQKAPRGKETRPSSLFYGNGGTKFPNTVNETFASKTFRPPTVRGLWQSQRTEKRYWAIIPTNSARPVCRGTIHRRLMRRRVRECIPRREATHGYRRLQLTAFLID